MNDFTSITDRRSGGRVMSWLLNWEQMVGKVGAGS